MDNRMIAETFQKMATLFSPEPEPSDSPAPDPEPEEIVEVSPTPPEEEVEVLPIPEPTKPITQTKPVKAPFDTVRNPQAASKADLDSWNADQMLKNWDQVKRIMSK